MNDTLFENTTQFIDFEISGRSSLTQYKIEITANNIHGQSNKSDPLLISTIDWPSWPNAVVVSEITDSPNIRFWFDKTVSNGSPITSYELSVLNHANVKKILSPCSFVDDVTSFYCDLLMSTLKGTVGLNNGDQIEAYVRAEN